MLQEKAGKAEACCMKTARSEHRPGLAGLSEREKACPHGRTRCNGGCNGGQVRLCRPRLASKACSVQKYAEECSVGMWFQNRQPVPSWGIGTSLAAGRANPAWLPPGTMLVIRFPSQGLCCKEFGCLGAVLGECVSLKRSSALQEAERLHMEVPSDSVRDDLGVDGLMS